MGSSRVYRPAFEKVRSLQAVQVLGLRSNPAMVAWNLQDGQDPFRIGLAVRTHKRPESQVALHYSLASQTDRILLQQLFLGEHLLDPPYSQRPTDSNPLRTLLTSQIVSEASVLQPHQREATRSQPSIRRALLLRRSQHDQAYRQC